MVASGLLDWGFEKIVEQCLPTAGPQCYFMQLSVATDMEEWPQVRPATSFYICDFDDNYNEVPCHLARFSNSFVDLEMEMPPARFQSRVLLFSCF